MRQTIAQQVGKLSTHFFAVFSSTLAALGSLLIVTFVAIYIALDPSTYRRGILHLVPHRGRAKAIEVMDATGVTLRRWLVAQLIGMVLIGALTTVALLRSTSARRSRSGSLPASLNSCPTSDRFSRRCRRSLWASSTGRRRRCGWR